MDEPRGMTKCSDSSVGSDPVWVSPVNQGGPDILGMQGDFKPTS